ncbi:DUF1345 domain-containing protein [Rhodococcus sp. T2V]|uniref:DUF1345 domain-containing protein n=1 Tax=Rhodococcus sp. T2V TaxID=3034164 RepID=UPI0023E238E1|nr:DUF1345 domain-containing protein [Rhodococcus sp. T2V]MDF3307340.1 DUF1345 domain-containing protein [Rhodococcus sp. T2V]
MPPSVGTWLSERRRSASSLLVAAVAAMLLGPIGVSAIGFADASVIVLLVYLVTYLVVTVAAFSLAPDAIVQQWAERESRGTILQRYVLGTAPGPGVSLFMAAVALAVAVVWLPGRGGGALPDPLRIGIAVVLVVVSWTCVLVSFAITFYADNVVEQGQALGFPGGSPRWASYVYFAVSVMTTFGTTDVDVTSDAMRRTVAVNAVIAFVFNTVTVATVVSVLAAS